MSYAKELPDLIKNQVNVCPLVYELAKTIMQSRQMGMPISDAIKPINGVDDKDIQELNKQIVISAYKTQVYELKEQKVEAIEVFANTYALMCLEAK